MNPLPSLSEIFDEWSFFPPKSEDHYRMLIELGEKLEPMPAALKSPATKVRGCSSDVWLYPPPAAGPEGTLHFLADSNSAFTKGIVALVLASVQGQSAAETAQTDITKVLEPFGLQKEFTSKRTQGIPNMIALVRDTAARMAV